MDPITILLIEDNPGDVRLIREALKDNKLMIHVNAVEDGVEAMASLRGEGRYAGMKRPDLIVLDLNLPRKGGLEVMAEIKADEALKRIPIVVLTTSEDTRDILTSYDNHANCYITKPVDFERFISIVKSIQSFWFSIVKLPPE